MQDNRASAGTSFGYYTLPILLYKEKKPVSLPAGGLGGKTGRPAEST
jgi:hypothetical protein